VNLGIVEQLSHCSFSAGDAIGNVDDFLAEQLEIGDRIVGAFDDSPNVSNLFPTRVPSPTGGIRTADLNILSP
jgi:hypothetical protein